MTPAELYAYLDAQLDRPVHSGPGAAAAVMKRVYGG